MERTKGSTQGIKKAAVMLALMAAMASTGCGQNALLNPTADQIAAGGGGSSLAKSTVDSGTHDPNPAAHDPNP